MFYPNKFYLALDKKATLSDKVEITMLFQVINITVTVDDRNIVYLSPSTGDPQTTIWMLRLIQPRGGKSEVMPLMVIV